MTTSITLSTQYGNYTISIGQDDMNLEDMITNLIVPVLLASGYQPDTIKEWIPDE